MFSNSSLGNSLRPLPLKQRTSSLDKRRDYSNNTWWSLLVLLKLREFFVTVDNFSIWRRHIAWAMESGIDLRAYMTQRYGSSMVFMSLLLSTELGILFNSAPVTTKVRETLREGHHDTISFWAGFMIIISALMTVLSLIATFTAWGMVSSINEANAHCIFRSSIGQYAAELPGRLTVCSIYFFLISFMMFFFLLLPIGQWSIILSAVTAFLFVHIVSVFSSFGRIIMHSGAMGDSRIFTPEYEDFLLPHSLHSNLLTKAQANLANNTSIIRQYRRKQQPIDRHLTAETMYEHLSGSSMEPDIPGNIAYRPRADSTVRFADVEQANKSNGGGGPNNSGSAFHHDRTLTPLSDTSSLMRSSERTSSDRAFIMADEKPTPTHSSLRKSSYGGPPRPRPSLSLPPYQQYRGMAAPPPPLGPLGGSTAMENVSTSSLEQWLQHANPAASSASVVYDGSGLARPTSATMTKGNNDNKAATIRATNPSPPPFGPTTSNTSAAPGNKRSDTPTSDTNAMTRLSPVSSSDRLTPSHSELSFDNRDLSEDERFAMDYGEFEEDDATPQKFASEYRVLSPPSRQMPLPLSGQTTNDTELSYNNDMVHDTTSEERRGLLDRANPHHFYTTGTTTPYTGGGPLYWKTTSAPGGGSPPPPPPPSNGYSIHANHK